MRLTLRFGHPCTVCCISCQSHRRSLLPKWRSSRRRGQPLLPSGSGTGFGAGTEAGFRIRSKFSSGALRTASEDRTSSILRSASVRFWILWRCRSLACSICSVACSKFCFCCCCCCCSSNKPSCSYCRSCCSILWERKCAALRGLLSVVGLVYAICSQEFCIWTLLFSAVCFDCILNVVPTVSPCIGYRKM